MNDGDNDDDYFYIQGPTVTQPFLRDHMDQHDTVLEESKSHVIAKHLAQALRRLQTPTAASSPLPPPLRSNQNLKATGTFVVVPAAAAAAAAAVAVEQTTTTKASASLVGQ